MIARYGFRGLLFALALMLSKPALAAPWQGVYYLIGKPGNAVEFQGAAYDIRTHDGRGVHEGEWTETNGVRIVRSCCQEFHFRRGDGDTLRDGEGATWDRTVPAWPLQKLKRAPLQIHVADSATGAPVTNYLFRYWLSSPDGQEYPPWVSMQRVVNTAGLVTIEAPLTCELGLKLDALDYQCHGSGYEAHVFDIVSTNTARQVTAHLERGLTVEGVVLDADTGRPVAGARVAPLIEYHPAECGSAGL